ncbi:hypothetical protein A2U01_0116994, partial [Trifolium medium]|nr:hypothetical protein [Trifolium medium]
GEELDTMKFLVEEDNVIEGDDGGSNGEDVVILNVKFDHGETNLDEYND